MAFILTRINVGDYDRWSRCSTRTHLARARRRPVIEFSEMQTIPARCS